MKKLISFLAITLLAVTMSFATVPRKIWTIADSGSYVYLTQSATNTLSTVATYRIDKKAIMVNTQSGFLYIKDVNGVIYPIHVGTDSFSSGTVNLTSLASAAALVSSYVNAGTKHYLSDVLTVGLIKTGRGVLSTVAVDSVGSGGKLTCWIWDGTSGADTISTNKPIWSGVITSLYQNTPNVKFTKGLYIKQKGGVAARVHVYYYLIEPEGESIGGRKYWSSY